MINEKFNAWGACLESSVICLHNWDSVFHFKDGS